MKTKTTWMRLSTPQKPWQSNPCSARGRDPAPGHLLQTVSAQDQGSAAQNPLQHLNPSPAAPAWLLAVLRARTEGGRDTCWPHWRAQSPAGHPSSTEGTQHGAGSVAGTCVLYAGPVQHSQRHLLLPRCLGEIFCAWHHRNTTLCPWSTVVPLISVWQL